MLTYISIQDGEDEFLY